MQYLLKILSVFMFVTFSFYAYYIYQTATNSQPQIIGFSYQENNLVFKISSNQPSFRFLKLFAIPERLNIKKLRALSIHANLEKGEVRIPLGNELDVAEYSILIFIGNNWFEVIRQSSQWLKEKLNFDKRNGYTILGRRMIDIQQTEVNHSSLIFRKTPNLPKIQEMGDSPYQEIRLAQGLLQYLWQDGFFQGPTSKSYHQFLKLSFEKKLLELRSGHFSIMCQGMRDLFLHAASGLKDLNVRAVDAYNYYNSEQSFAELIPYSHATLEVFVRDLDKFVLFDPWLGIIITNAMGEPVSASELKAKHGKKNVFKVKSIINKLSKNIKQADTKLSKTERQIKLDGMSCYQNECSPGYRVYFNKVFYRKHEIFN